MEGDWSVALTEMSYPFTFYNVTEKHNEIQIIYDKYTIDGDAKIYQVEKMLESVFVAPCFCSSINQLIDVVNENFHAHWSTNLFEQTLTKANQVVIVKNISRKVIEIQEQHVADGLSHSVDKLVYAEKASFFTKYAATREVTYERFEIRLKGRLAIQFGFQPEKNIAEYSHSPQAASQVFGVPDQLFIYSDVIMPQEISDKCSQVLKIVKTVDHNSGYGEVISRETFNLNYIPLCKKKFQIVEIELRDSLGQLAAFQFGCAIVQLHFKKSPKLN